MPLTLALIDPQESDDPNGNGHRSDNSQVGDFNKHKQILMRATIDYMNKNKSLSRGYNEDWVRIADFAQYIITNELPRYIADRKSPKINTKIRRVCQGSIIIDYYVVFIWLPAGISGIIEIITHYKEFREGIDQLKTDSEYILKLFLKDRFNKEFDVKAEVIGENKKSFFTKLNCILILNIVLLILVSALVYLELSKVHFS